MEMEVAATNDREVLLEMFNLPEDAKAMLMRPTQRSQDWGNPKSLFDVWYDAHASFSEIVSLTEFKDKLNSPDWRGNFVYYRPRGIVFNTLNPCDHSNFMAGVYNLHLLANGARETGSDFDVREDLAHMFCQKYDGQDKYLKEGLGVYQSSCGRRVSRHKNLALTPQEQKVFQDMEQQVYDY